MIANLIARFTAWRHRRWGHRIDVMPNLTGEITRLHYYCSCGEEWVG